MPLDAAGSPAFAERIVREVRPRWVVGDRLLLGQLGTGPSGAPERFAFELLAQLPIVVAPAPPALTSDSPLQIVFTSGTTGEPKGVVHTHGNLLASLAPIEREVEEYRRYERWVHPLRILHTLPLSHVFGQFMGLWIAPVLGATVHYENRLTGPGLTELIAEEHIHVLAATPRTLGILRAHLLATEPALVQEITASQGESLPKRWWRFRRVHRALGMRFWAAVCGGATLPAGVEQFWTTLGFALIQGYGLTETAALGTLNHPFQTSGGSVGKALPGRKMRVSATGELEVQGPMVSTLTWQGGALQQSAPGSEPWLATGDLAEIAEDGQLRFRGRTGQRLVTSAGLNVYLQDVEAALVQQPELREALVLNWQASEGDEPAAVVVADGGAHTARLAVARANASLAPHQQVRRWWLWPSLALPKTATGKAQRRLVEDWARGQAHPDPGAPAAQADPLLDLLDSIASRRDAPAKPMADNTQLVDGWELDSMGRVALGAALEDRLGLTVGDSSLAQIETLGQLRALVAPSHASLLAPQAAIDRDPDGWNPPTVPRATGSLPVREERALASKALMSPLPRYQFPRWPWSGAVQTLRSLFIRGLLRPLVRLQANPAIVIKPGPDAGSGRFPGSVSANPQGPMLLIANHRTAVDVPLLLYALPPGLRGRVAVAMSGEMLLGWQTSWSRRTQLAPVAKHHRWWGPVAAFLVQALFNIFPLPQNAGFRAGFRHAGRALDRGYSVLLFPEGRRWPNGTLLPFKPGLGILALEAGVPVLPMALAIAPQREPGCRRVRPRVLLGAPVRIDPNETPQDVTEQLRARVAALLGDRESA